MSTTEQASIRLWAHRIGFWEGISYLILLGIAMPLKYMWDKPEYVRTVGSAHGLLFVMFMLMLTYALANKAISFKQAAFAFLLSLIPFGTFFLSFNKSVD
jgi:integral membrane protein